MSSRNLELNITESVAFNLDPTYALICVDQRYTQFFVVRVAPVLATTKQWSSFWETMVPCTSIYDSSIHHAMLALSMAWESKFLAVDHSRLVRQQTSLAIRSTVSQTNSTYNVLVLCRLLAAVSQCEGDWQTTMIHLRHGWRVLIEGVRSGELDPSVVQLFGPTFLSASKHTFDQLDELPHIQSTLQEPFRKLEAIRSRFSKKMAIVDWTEIQSDGVRNTIVVSWSLMTRSICSLVYPTKSAQTSPIHASARSIIEVKLKLEADQQTLTLGELCIESGLLFHKLAHALCAKDKEDSVIYEHLQRLRIVVENFLVQVMELNPTVEVDVFWYQEQSLGCDIDRHLLHPSLHEPSPDSGKNIICNEKGAPTDCRSSICGFTAFRNT